MVVTSIGGKNYVAGMRWLDMHSLNPKKSEYIAALAEQGKNTKAPEGVFMLSDSKSSAVFGFISQEDSPPEGRLYSLAATLAKGAADGIYITRIQGESDLLWMFVAKDSVVSPNTDAFMDEGELRSRCDMILSIMPDLTVFTNESFFASTYNGQEWTIEAALQKQNPVLIGLVGSSGVSPLVLVGGVVALIVFGVVANMLMDKPKIKTGPTPEEEAAMARANYVSGLQPLTLNVVPLSSEWVDEALATIKSNYAVNRYGWSFQGANCNPTTCNLIYASDGDRPRSVESLAVSINKPKDSAAMSDSGKTAQFGVALTTPTSFEMLTEESIKALPLTTDKQAAWTQFVGMAPLRMPKSQPANEVAVDDYSMMIPPPPDMPGVTKGLVSIKGTNPKDMDEARRLMKIQGIEPNRLVVSFGTGMKQSAAWHIEYVFFGSK